MSVEREEGLEALRRGDSTTAIDLLTRASQQNPQDYEASMYLGAAYGQAGRHSDAVQALTQAVQLQPANAQARYNLAVALEQAGWPNEATTAYEQAVTLQPDYTKAAEALSRLRGAPVSPPQPTQAVVYAPTGQPEPTMAAPAYAAPGYAPPAGGYAPPGTVPPPGYVPPGQPQTPGSAPQGYGGRPEMAVGYTAGPYGAQPVMAYGDYANPGFQEDKFSIKQAFQDWKRVLTSPQNFFREQVGREGKNEPFAMLVTYLLTSIVLTAIGMSIGSLSNPSGIPLLIFFLGIGLVFAILFGLLVTYISSGFLHLVGKIFGNRSGFGASFRAVIYAAAPYYAVSTITSLISGMVNGGRTTQAFANVFSGNANRAAIAASSPGVEMLSLLAGILTIVSGIWGLYLLVIGLSNTQKTSVGGAVGTVIIGAVLPWVLFFGMIAVLIAAAAPH